MKLILTDEMKVIIGIIIFIGILCFVRWCIDKKDNDDVNNKLKYNNFIKYINKGKDIESLIDDCIDNIELIATCTNL